VPSSSAGVAIGTAATGIIGVGTTGAGITGGTGAITAGTVGTITIATITGLIMPAAAAGSIHAAIDDPPPCRSKAYPDGRPGVTG
jgi:hypothetical protein